MWLHEVAAGPGTEEQVSHANAKRCERRVTRGFITSSASVAVGPEDFAELCVGASKNIWSALPSWGAAIPRPFSALRAAHIASCSVPVVAASPGSSVRAACRRTASPMKRSRCIKTGASCLNYGQGAPTTLKLRGQGATTIEILWVTTQTQLFLNNLPPQ